MANKKKSRLILTIIAAIVVAAALTYAFWPRPTLVDMSTISQGYMKVTVEEEARTRVHDAYVVSAPVSGQLLRVDLEPGDAVEQGETVVVRMLPATPPALNLRQREQARTAVESARAALEVAKANLKRARAENALAETTYKRAVQQREAGVISQAAMDEAERSLQSTEAAVENAIAEIAVREAEIENAKAAMISVERATSSTSEMIQIKAPISGRILNVVQKSETTMSAGQPIIEIGDVENDLEVLVELISTDAVKVETGDRVIIENWGSEEPLEGEVVRIDPYGFTKYSALGVEEQRVNTIVRFTGGKPATKELGHGYRVEVQIVIWEADDAVIVPTSALFRQDGGWAVYVVENEKAVLRDVEIDKNNGIQASVKSGLQTGDRVILYPPSELVDGAAVKQRQNGETDKQL